MVNKKQRLQKQKQKLADKIDKYYDRAIDLLLKVRPLEKQLKELEKIK